MKSASRPGSVMFAASVCRSSESSGDSDTTCWKFVLMFRSSASISSRSSSCSPSTAGVTRAAQIRARFRDLVEREPREALHDQPEAAVGQLEHLVDVAGGPDGVEVVLLRLLDRCVPLRENANQLAGRDRLVDQPHRALTRHRERHERVGEQHGVAQRQDRQLVGNGERPVAGRQFLEIERVVTVTHGGCSPTYWMRARTRACSENWLGKNPTPNSQLPGRGSWKLEAGSSRAVRPG